MADFLSTFNDPDKIEERKQIRALTRCTETEAIFLQWLQNIANAIEAQSDQMLTDDMAELTMDDDDDLGSEFDR